MRVARGGGQERGRRSGTEDIAGAVGLATALELAEAERAESSARVAARRDAFITRVLASVPTAQLTGDPVHRLPGTASFTFAGTSGEAVLLELERRGIVLALARVKFELRGELDRAGLTAAIGEDRIFETLPQAVAAYVLWHRERFGILPPGVESAPQPSRPAGLEGPQPPPAP